MGWVSWPLYIFVFLASFSALWWPNIWPKMEFPEIKKKTIGSIHFIPGFYPYGMSPLTPIHFRVPSLIFGPLVAKWCLNSSGTKFSWRIPTCVAHDCKIKIFIGYFWMRWVVIRAGVYCPQLWAQLVSTCFNTLRPRQNGRHFPDDMFKCIFLNENVLISIKISLKFVPKGPINNIPALVQIMAWCRPGDKPLSDPMMIILLTHICVTRPQLVNSLGPIDAYASVS